MALFRSDPFSIYHEFISCIQMVQNGPKCVYLFDLTALYTYRNDEFHNILLATRKRELFHVCTMLYIWRYPLEYKEIGKCNHNYNVK